MAGAEAAPSSLFSRYNVAHSLPPGQILAGERPAKEKPVSIDGEGVRRAELREEIAWLLLVCLRPLRSLSSHVVAVRRLTAGRGSEGFGGNALLITTHDK